jgi:hypothetical protein
MSRWCSLLMFGVALISFCHAGARQVPFTPAGISSISGKNICELQGEFPRQLGVYLDQRKEHAVQYRERDGVIAIFLLSKPSSANCGVVDAVLDLTPLIKAGESPEFKCYTGHEGGTTWGKWGHIVGLANNHRGTKRFVKARLAWRVNIANKRFETIDDKAVRCDTSGYED